MMTKPHLLWRNSQHWSTIISMWTEYHDYLVIRDHLTQPRVCKQSSPLGFYHNLVKDKQPIIISPAPRIRGLWEYLRTDSSTYLVQTVFIILPSFNNSLEKPTSKELLPSKLKNIWMFRKSWSDVNHFPSFYYNFYVPELTSTLCYIKLLPGG